MKASAQNSTNAIQSSGWCSITTSSSSTTIRWTSSDGAALVDFGLVFMAEGRTFLDVVPA